MKKMPIVRSRKRFNGEEGSTVRDIPREPLRDSSGEIVRDSSGEAVMSGGSEKKFKSGPKGYLDDDIRPPKSDTDKEPTPPRKEEKKEPTRVSSEYDTETGLDYAPSMGPTKSKPDKKPTPPKKPETKPEKKPEPVSSGRGASSGKTAEQEEEGRKKFAEDKVKKLQKEDKPLEEVHPESHLGPGRVLKFLHGTAKSLAAKEAPKVAGLLGRSKNVGENLTKDMGPVQYAAGRRSMLQNQSGSSEPIRQGMNPRYRPEQGKRNAAARKAKQEEKDVQTFENEGGRAMRKGGKVAKYAKGGSVGSASRRADGAAIRGKTRGKMF